MVSGCSTFSVAFGVVSDILLDSIHYSVIGGERFEATTRSTKTLLPRMPRSRFAHHLNTRGPRFPPHSRFTLPMPSYEFMQAIILGVIQGIAEFLPISSSGHLVIFEELLGRCFGANGVIENKMDLNVALHLGTLFSIIVVFWSDLWALLRNWRLCVAIVVATIPAAVIGLSCKDTLESAFNSPLIAGCGLLVTATLLALSQKLERNEKSLESLSMPMAFIIGVFQAMALIPGISRSGSTIGGGLLLGLQREAAASFSFFIAIPAIAGASLITAKGLWETPTRIDSISVLGAGLLTSFVVGVIALRWLLRIIARGKLHWFAYYCAVAGTATIVWQTIEHFGT